MIFKIKNLFKPRFVYFYTLLTLISFFDGALNAQTFDKTKDILVAQFDNKPDADDIQAQAGFACIMMHPDAKDLNFYVVTGAYGKQGGRYIDSNTLLTMAFGDKNGKWTDANTDRAGSVTRIKEKVKPILQAGGKVWVMEAGQSDFTLLWINALLADGVPEATVKNNVLVVQHSSWNENEASAGVLNAVKLKANYIPIDDGNNDMGTGTNRGPDTPNFKSGTTATDLQYLKDAKSSTNPNKTARDLWTETDRIIKASGFAESYSPIDEGGLDFSDEVEVWYILGLGDNASTIRKFWDRYVVNVPATPNGIDIVNTKTNNEITVYPNPATDKLHVNTNGKQINKIQLIDISGKLVYTSSTTNQLTSIDLTGILSGIYIAKIYTEDNIYTSKISKYIF